MLTSWAKAGAFNDYFASFFSSSELVTNRVPENLFPRFALSDYLNAINSIYPKSSPGPDQIPMFFCITSKDRLGVIITNLFNKFLENSYVRDIWKQDLVFPLYKQSGKVSELQSYRPISLTCSLSKLFEKMLIPKLAGFISEKKLIPLNQFGFKKASSTIFNLISSYNFISNLLDRGLSADVVYLDFSKAFDMVPHKNCLRN